MLTLSRQYLLLFFSMSVITVLFSSCLNDQEIFSEEDSVLIEDQLISEEIVANINTSMDLNGARLQTIQTSTGKKEPFYLVEGDILIPEQQYLQMTSGDKQYHTTNLVNNCRTITISGRCGPLFPGSDAVTDRVREAIDFAVNHYNGLHRLIGIKFQVLPCDQYEEADIKVFFDPLLRNGYYPDQDIPSMAGWPDEMGNPFSSILIGPALLEFRGPQDVYTDITLVHEIGHCLGFRHTDWMRPTSCSENNPPPGEEENGIGGGAHHIPGTPMEHRDFESVMRRCPLSSNAPNPYLTRYDVLSLRYMYPEYPCRPDLPNQGGGLILLPDEPFNP